MGKCSKDKRDIFYRLAKEEGWRARSAFKLLQIDDQCEIFDKVTRAVDLCAAPGSWSQVIAKRLKEESAKLEKCEPDKEVKVVAVDIQTMAPIEGVSIIQGDITCMSTAQKVIEAFKGSRAHLVVCDGAPDVTGQHDLDEFIQSQLLLAALNITTFILQRNGTFVAKIFRGKDISLMIAQFRIFFKQVRVVKPKSSRASSIEAFIVCREFEEQVNYKPRMFDLTTDVDELDLTTEKPNSQSDFTGYKDRTKTIIPFLMCGDLNDLKPRNEKHDNRSQPGEATQEANVSERI